jgi:hypothetical protein
MIYHSHPLEGTGVRVYLSSSSSRNNLLAAHAYTKHVDQTFRSAPMHSKEGTFKDGIALGRRLQLEDDSIHFSRYRGRLQMARKQQEELHVSQHRYRERTKSLEAEIGVLRDRLMAMQMAYDDIVGRVDGAPPSQWASEFSSFEPKSHINSPASSTGSFEHAENASNTWPDDDAVMVRREEAGFGFSDDGDDEDDFLLAQQLQFMDGRERREDGQFWAGFCNDNVRWAESSLISVYSTLIPSMKATLKATATMRPRRPHLRPLSRIRIQIRLRQRSQTLVFTKSYFQRLSSKQSLASTSSRRL